MNDGWRRRWLGIDFSGDYRKWGAGCRSSNVWIAEVAQERVLTLASLRRVQELPGDEVPFHRLRALLAARQFNAAGIDAPFSLPSEYLGRASHRDLLTAVAAIPRPEGRFFPDARAFVDWLTAGRAIANKKPLRQTERRWQKVGVNVRSTLWAGARGGAAMTSACLTILGETRCPIWPWNATGPGLLVEAFPAAQLRHWGLPHQQYSGDELRARHNRKRTIEFVSEYIRIEQNKYRIMGDSADALDAVVCAFAAIAVTTGPVGESAAPQPPEEGTIAVCRAGIQWLKAPGNTDCPKE